MQKVFFLFLLVSLSAKAQIKFDSLSWSTALQQAKATNKPVLVYAFTQWCEPCADMEEYVFSDLEVGNYFNREFISIKTDVEDYAGVDFAEKYAVGVYTSFIFFNGFGEVIHRGCGAMDASDFLMLGEIALKEEQNLMYYEKQYGRGNRSTDLVMNYLSTLEYACLDAEGFASDYLKTLGEKELTGETAWSVIASYQWDIYSREFQYLLQNQSDFEAAIDPAAVQAKIYDTYMGQYQEVFAAEELHGFGMRALLHSISQTNFIGSDTLKAMMQLHYAEYMEDWDDYADHAIRYVELMQLTDPEELGELAWQFYLFVNDRQKLELASTWASKAVEQLPDPSIIDTYASLQFKLGNRKKAVELETRALELANELYDDTTHFEYQLKRFKEE